MKRILIALAVVALGIMAVIAFKNQMQTVTVGEMYRGDGDVVTVEFVGRGDSVLIKYPGVFAVSDGQLRTTMVVYRDGKRLYAQMMEAFKQEYQHVQTTPPPQRQP